MSELSFLRSISSTDEDFRQHIVNLAEKCALDVMAGECDIDDVYRVHGPEVGEMVVSTVSTSLQE